MRKYALTIAILVSLSWISKSQSPWEIQRKLNDQKIDSMKKVLSTLKGKERVDCLNILAEDYFWRYVGYNWKQMVDSSWLIAVQANSEAKRINYKKGLGYSFMRMGILKSYEFGAYLQEKNRKDSVLLNLSEQNAKLAILIGEELKDNLLLASAFLVVAWVAEHKQGFAQYVNYLKKAISYY